MLTTALTSLRLDALKMQAAAPKEWPINNLAAGVPLSVGTWVASHAKAASMSSAKRGSEL